MLRTLAAGLVAAAVLTGPTIAMLAVALLANPAPTACPTTTVGGLAEDPQSSTGPATAVDPPRRPADLVEASHAGEPDSSPLGEGLEGIASPPSEEPVADRPAAMPGHLCDSSSLPGPPALFAGSPGGRVPDPTGTGGFVTRQTAHLITQARAVFPATGWSCWAARPGSRSEHPLGRACDVTFGNPIGVLPDQMQVAEGWRLATWLQTHAEPLQVQYLIWQGRIWSLTRDHEGWRPYHGGGMHDPTTPTGGHYDHLHITNR